MKKILLTIILFLAFTSTAQAMRLDERVLVEPSALTRDVVPYSGELEEVEAIAKVYWAKRNVTLPSEVYLYFMEPKENIWAMAELSGNEIWLTHDLYETLMSDTYNGKLAFCIAYIHERGHNAGFLDNEGVFPIMDYATEYLQHIPMCIRMARS